MIRVNGSIGVLPLECVNPMKNKWRVRWDIQIADDTATYMEEEFSYKPTAEEIKALLKGWYNGQTEAYILSGFEYNGVPVWLSGENQFNYKAAYDLAVQTGGTTLPVTFKLGTDEQPQYHTFSTLEELFEFYTGAMMHVQYALSQGWKKKDEINLNLYI